MIKVHLSLLASGSAIALGALPAFAQEPRTEGHIDEVIVTAQKREQSVFDVGASVNVLSGDQLEKLGATTPRDLLKSVTGLTIAGDDSNPIYTMRGIGFTDVGSFSANPTVTTYVDEIPLPYLTMIRGAVLDVQRVEVLKGPQGTLFGQNATGGAINYIANKPTDTFAAGAEASYGNYDTFSANGYISGPVVENLNARLAATASNSKGWQYSISRPQEKNGETDFVGARLLLDWHPIDKLRVLFNANGWRDKGDTQQQQNVIPDQVGRLANPTVPEQAFPEIYTLPFTPNNSRASDWDSNQTQGFARDNEQWQVAMRMDYDINDQLQFSSLTSYAELDLFSRDGDGAPQPQVDSFIFGNIQSFFQEARLTGRLDSPRINYVVGGNYSTGDIDQDAIYNFIHRSANNNPALGYYEEAGSTARWKDRDWGIFGNVEWEPIDNLTLTAGIRYAESHHEFGGCTLDPVDSKYALNPGTVDIRLARAFGRLSSILAGQGVQDRTPPYGDGGCITTNPADPAPRDPFYVRNEFDENNVSWKLGTNYKFSADAMMYATVSKGFKSGSYPTTLSISSTQYSETHQEKVLAYEVGTKLFLMERSLQANLAAFYYDYGDKQLNVIFIDDVFGPLVRLGNVPDSRVYGVEAAFTWKPLPGLAISPGVTYTDSKIESHLISQSDIKTPIDVKGNSFSYTPEWIGTLDTEYAWPLPGELQAFVGGNLLYNSVAYSDLGHNRGGVIRSFSTVDLRAGIEKERWRTFLWGKNVTDTRYWSTANSQGAEWNSRLTRMPRTYGVTVSYKF